MTNKFNELDEAVTDGEELMKQPVKAEEMAGELVELEEELREKEVDELYKELVKSREQEIDVTSEVEEELEDILEEEQEQVQTEEVELDEEQTKEVEEYLHEIREHLSLLLQDDFDREEVDSVIDAMFNAYGLETKLVTEYEEYTSKTTDEIAEDILDTVEIAEEVEEVNEKGETREQEIQRLIAEQQLEDDSGFTYEEYKEKIAETSVVRDTVFKLRGQDGEELPVRQTGEYTIEVLPIDSIKLPRQRSRVKPTDTFSLQESIRLFGQLEPVHVVKFGNFNLLLDGYRRLDALKKNGETEVVAVVDSTIAPELVKYYEVIINSSEPYTFSEKLNYARFMQGTQPEIGVNVVEGILGMANGELYKALYVDSMKGDYPEPYQQLELGKISIEQAFTKLEKEKEKEEKELAKAEEDLNSGELDEKLSDVNELTDLKNDPDQQDVYNRKILDPIVRRNVEARDEGKCQCCNFGEGESDFSGVFQVHHMVAVMYGGSDSKENLILLCQNCHSLVHDYENGRFQPSEETYEKHEWVQRVVVLGNILRSLRTRSLGILRNNHEDTARLVDSRKLGLGKAIHKEKIELKAEEKLGGSPYKAFMKATGQLEEEEADSEEIKELSKLDE